MINEQRSSNPLLPLSIFRIRGLTAADVTQLIAFAGFLAMFFFLTLYMQNVLGYSPIHTRAACCASLRAGCSSPRVFGRPEIERQPGALSETAGV